ncbi:uncharacterized protein [Heptranchias perlo]|uniref:uncharacterized protein n=1 Tax=Heptranchias perlo TaxID=212740 RepID=UPI00355A2F88
MDTEVENMKYHEIQAHKDPVILLKHDMDHSQLLSMSQETKSKRLKIWNLPKLQLIQEIPIPREAVAFSRIGSQLCLGLKSGMIDFNDIMTTDSTELTFPSIVSQDLGTKCESAEKRGMDQTGDVVTTDACSKQNIFLSCGGDNAIKIWDVFGSLLTEVVLDHTLTFACFLNDQGDILIGFKEHLFLIPHKKLMIDIEDALSDDSVQATPNYRK